jgi:hypothetical protein
VRIGDENGIGQLPWEIVLNSRKSVLSVQFDRVIKLLSDLGKSTGFGFFV